MENKYAKRYDKRTYCENFHYDGDQKSQKLYRLCQTTSDSLGDRYSPKYKLVSQQFVFKIISQK